MEVVESTLAAAKVDARDVDVVHVVRMLLDAAKQVSETAGDYQVEGATIFGTLNLGGSTATTVSFIVGKA